MYMSLWGMLFLVFVTAAVVFFVIGYCLYGAFVTACRADSWGKRVIAIIGLLSMIGYIVLAFR